MRRQAGQASSTSGVCSARRAAFGAELDGEGLEGGVEGLVSLEAVLRGGLDGFVGEVLELGVVEEVEDLLCDGFGGEGEELGEFGSDPVPEGFEPVEHGILLC